MTNKNSLSLGHYNPFSNLTKKEIDFYYYLRSWKYSTLEIFEVFLSDSNTDDIEFEKEVYGIEVKMYRDKSFNILNKYIAEDIQIHPTIISKYLKQLHEYGLINIKYTNSGYGIIRQIYVEEFPT